MHRTGLTITLVATWLLSGCADDQDVAGPPTTPSSDASGEVANERARGLGALVFDGPELHPSLRTHEPDAIRHLPRDMVLPSNPYWSDEDAFVEAVARGSSQGNLDRDGMVAALYAMYVAGDMDLGIYGLEAATDADADAREQAQREIWAYNGQLDRARVHRNDRTLIVIWHDGVSPACWAAVNARVVERLSRGR